MAAAISNHHGSTSVEAAVVLLSFTAMLSATFFVTYIAFMSVWIDREGYEALICLSSLAQVYDCEADLRKGVDAALPIGRLSLVNLSRSTWSVQASLQFRISDIQVFNWSESKRLPLQPAVRFQ